jgi:hypothetical protein
MATHTYRFSEFQAGLVESGKKTMTIRAPRKAPTRVGDTLGANCGRAVAHVRGR